MQCLSITLLYLEYLLAARSRLLFTNIDCSKDSTVTNELIDLFSKDVNSLTPNFINFE